LAGESSTAAQGRVVDADGRLVMLKKGEHALLTCCAQISQAFVKNDFSH